jgi:hypothetical protein
MAFCSRNTETIGFANFATSYTGVLPTLTSTPNNFECLPTPDGFSSSFVTNGIVTDNKLTEHITDLLTKINANPPTTANQSNVNQAATFATNSKKLRTALETEYCYYYVRYKFGLEQVLTAATSQALSSTTVANTTSADSTIINQTPSITYGSAKTTTVLLNKKLNELIQIMQKLQSIRFESLNTGADSYYSKFNSSATDSTTFNGKLKAQQESLAAQSALLQSGSFNDDVKQSMIDYTLEKNASSRNLLAVYGFMNIVAVGLLFYMYKASK